MRLNKVGKIVEWEWLELPKRLPYVELGVHVVMPNHFHGILFIHETVGATRQGQAMSLSGAEHLQTITTDGIDGSPLLMDQNPRHWAQLLLNSNRALQNAFGNFLNTTKHLSGNATTTNTSSATKPTCKTKRITSSPIRGYGMRTTRTQSMQNLQHKRHWLSPVSFCLLILQRQVRAAVGTGGGVSAGPFDLVGGSAAVGAVAGQ